MKRFILSMCVFLGLMGSAHAAPFFKGHALIFIFASTCPHCHHQAPVVKAWAERAGADVEAYSFDGKPLPSFPQAFPVDKALVDAAFRGKEIRYPATFVLNTETAQLYPVAVGALSEVEFSTRMQALIPKIQAHEARSAR